MRRTFKFRATINKDTESKALEWFSLCQRLYNCALEQRIDAYNKGFGKRDCVDTTTYGPGYMPKRGVNEYDQAKQLVELKKEFPEYALVGSQVLKDVLKRLDLAFKAFFRRAKSGAGASSGFPKFRGYQYYTSFTFPNSSGWRINGKYIEVDHVGRFKMYDSRRLFLTINSVVNLVPQASRNGENFQVCTTTIKKERSGRWFVVFSCKDVPTHPLEPTNKTVGIDVGITHFSMDSEGNRTENPKFFEQEQKRLRVLQRKLSRAQKGSKRREQCRLEVARLHEKIANRRQDFICKTAHEYASRYDRIAAEKLNIKGMASKGGDYPKLPKKIHDAAWRQFHFRLESQCEDHGREFIQVPAPKTTMTCSQCGAQKEIPLEVRVYECPACGMVKDRTLNSAMNIKARAFG